MTRPTAALAERAAMAERAALLADQVVKVSEAMRGQPAMAVMVDQVSQAWMAPTGRRQARLVTMALTAQLEGSEVRAARVVKAARARKLALIHLAVTVASVELAALAEWAATAQRVLIR